MTEGINNNDSFDADDIAIPKATNTRDGKTASDSAFKLHKRSRSPLKYKIIKKLSEVEKVSSEYLVDDPYKLTHYKYFTTDNNKPVCQLYCAICGLDATCKKLTAQYLLVRHLSNHTKHRPFTCPTCGKSFRQHSTLYQHASVHSVAKPYVCEVCLTRFSRASALWDHRKIHLEQHPYVCSVCSKGFSQKGNLQTHMYTHSQERPYQCAICVLGFHQLPQLIIHKQKVHGDSPNQCIEFNCSYCDETFTDDKLLIVHQEHHQKSNNPVAAVATTQPPNLATPQPGAMKTTVASSENSVVETDTGADVAHCSRTELARVIQQECGSDVASFQPERVSEAHSVQDITEETKEDAKESVDESSVQNFEGEIVETVKQESVDIVEVDSDVLAPQVLYQSVSQQQIGLVAEICGKQRSVDEGVAVIADVALLQNQSLVALQHRAEQHHEGAAFGSSGYLTLLSQQSEGNPLIIQIIPAASSQIPVACRIVGECSACGETETDSSVTHTTASDSSTTPEEIIHANDDARECVN